MGPTTTRATGSGPQLGKERCAPLSGAEAHLFVDPRREVLLGRSSLLGRLLGDEVQLESCGRAPRPPRRRTAGRPARPAVGRGRRGDRRAGPAVLVPNGRTICFKALTGGGKGDAGIASLPLIPSFDRAAVCSPAGIVGRRLLWWLVRQKQCWARLGEPQGVLELHVHVLDGAAATIWMSALQCRR
jgi:hypothetical protein